MRISALGLAALAVIGMASPASAYRPITYTAWLKNESSANVRVQFSGGQWVEVSPNDGRRFGYQNGQPHMLVEFMRGGQWAYACSTTLDRNMGNLTVRGNGNGVTCSVSETTAW